MLIGQKHLVKCRCVLPQYKNSTNPIRHQFVVFSIANDDKVIPKFVQCNNCGIVHKVVDFCRSEIVQGRETLASLVKIEEIKPSINANIAGVLESNNADLATWEAIQFLIENKRWGDFVVLSSDVDDGLKQGKYIRILGENLFKIETFVCQEFVS